MADRKTTGGCSCGAVTFEATGDPGMVIQCHCLECQKSSGAGHVPFAGYPAPQVSVKVPTKSWPYKADSGATASRYFCAECGSVVYGTTTSFPGLMAIRLGAMADSSAFEPQMAVYTKRLQKWDHDLQGKPAFETMPPMPGKS